MMMMILLAVILIFNYWRTKAQANAWMLLFAGAMIQQVITDAIDGRPLFDDLQRWLQNWPLAVGYLMVVVVLGYYGRRWGRRWEKQIESDREYFHSSRIGPN